MGEISRVGARVWYVYKHEHFEAVLICCFVGDLVFLTALGAPILIVSSAEAAFDLMEKRSALYSDRPRSVMLELYECPRRCAHFLGLTHSTRSGWDIDLAVMPHSPRWRAVRKMFHQYFNQHASQQHRTKLTKHVHAFLLRCLDQTGKELDPLSIRQSVLFAFNYNRLAC